MVDGGAVSFKFTKCLRLSDKQIFLQVWSNQNGFDLVYWGSQEADIEKRKKDLFDLVLRLFRRSMVVDYKGPNGTPSYIDMPSRHTIQYNTELGMFGSITLYGKTYPLNATIKIDRMSKKLFTEQDLNDIDEVFMRKEFDELPALDK